MSCRRGSAAAARIAGAAAVGLLATGCRESEIESPSLRSTETPVEYPVELWDRNVEGVALLRVLVNAEGGVDSVMIVGGSGEAALDSAALRGGWKMEFEPARRNGKPVRVWARVPVHFSREEGAPAMEGDR